jgi:hypothetical protein
MKPLRCYFLQENIDPKTPNPPQDILVSSIDSLRIFILFKGPVMVR